MDRGNGRKGITAAGNFIIDHIKIIDVWPEEGMLSIILDEKRANGGCPYNVLKDLAALKAEIPLKGIGLVGNDENGDFILHDLEEKGIDVSDIKKVEGGVTSYTDVMTVKDTGRRTFFHNKGVNSNLDIEHFDFANIDTRIFHIGYILLLDSLDREDSEYGTRFARLLKMAKDSGLKTSVDVVSESSDRFGRLVPPALKYADYLVINEIEAGKTSGFEIRRKDGSLDTDNLKRTMDFLVEKGNSELVCIHFPEGAYGYMETSDEGPLFVPTYNLEPEEIKGTVGAGDAFCSGILFGMHEGWGLEKSMRFANAMAAICLGDSSASDGMKSLTETLRFMETSEVEERLLF